MSDTETPEEPTVQTDAVAPSAVAPVMAQPTPKPWGLLVATAIIALVLGFAGGIASHAIFPQKAGPAGAEGPQGKTGPQGEAGQSGAAGAAASIDLSKIGFCFNVNNNTSGTVSFVDGVSIFAPTDTNGTLSCSIGQYVTLQPTLPNGGPSNYTP